MRIARRFNGPPDSGNGGYVCGLLAGAFGSSGVTVRLHQPPPLEVPLELRSSLGEASLQQGEVLIASARRVPALELDVPRPPSLADARAAEQRYAGLHSHAFPTCFVCGPERERGDGLCIFPGAIADASVAATWTPSHGFADDAGQVRPEFLWAAMDCSGTWAIGQGSRLTLLGEMGAEIERADVCVGEPLIVTGWGVTSTGRKHIVGTALHRPDGAMVARAKATWITVRD